MSLFCSDVNLLHLCSPGLTDKFMAGHILFVGKVVRQSVLKMPPFLLPPVVGRQWKLTIALAVLTLGAQTTHGAILLEFVLTMELTGVTQDKAKPETNCPMQYGMTQHRAQLFPVRLLVPESGSNQHCSFCNTV